MRLSFQRSLLAISVMAVTALTGCSKTADPEDPVVLGIPSNTAYLGVEYDYNFGAFGGDDTLGFSLSNAPAWMALERISNNARSGIVLRGVPGITGGRRGESDLGTNEQIQIVANDGTRLGNNTFTVEVQHNALFVDDIEVTEGQPFLPRTSDQPVPADELEEGEEDTSTECQLPQVRETLPEDAAEDEEGAPLTGTYLAQDIAILNESGTAFEKVDREFDTYAVVIPVRLDQPSVEPVVVAWQLRDEFDDVNNCVVGDLEQGGCQYAPRNRDAAIFTQDYVSESGSGGALADAKPDYLTYEGPASGLVEFAPGKTTCYVRVEIVDDTFPENEETFELVLTEVLDGLASVSENSADATGVITIKDDEPSVSFEVEERVISEGQTIEITAKLNRVSDTSQDGEDSEAELEPRTQVLQADITNSDVEEATALDSDFVFVDSSGNELTGSITLTFPVDQDTVTFGVKALANTSDGLGAEDTEDAPESKDDRIVLAVDENQQFGRDNYARAQENETVDIYINEWLSSPDLSTIASGFIPTGIATGLFSELYLTGVAGNTVPGSVADGTLAEGDEYVLHRINRLGVSDSSNLLEGEPISSTGRVWQPKLSATWRDAETQADIESELGIVVAASTDGVLSDVPQGLGGRDVVLSALYDNETGDVDTYQVQWQKQLGSSANDTVNWVDAPNFDSVYFGAVTNGSWPDATDTPGGRQDIAVVSLEGIENDGAIEQVNVSGTALDDFVVGGGAGGSTNSPISYGYSSGSLVSEDQVGQADFISMGVLGSASGFDRVQAGTQEQDIPSAAHLDRTVAVVVGSAPFAYSFDSEEEELSATDFKSRRQAYVIQFEAFREIKTAFSLTGGTGDEHLYAVKVQSGLAVAGGSTTGVFEEGAAEDGVEDPIIVALETVDGLLEEKWRRQLEGVDPARVIDIAIHQAREIFVLLENSPSGGGKTYDLVLFDADGNRLDN